jgi:hypothetical protein
LQFDNGVHFPNEFPLNFTNFDKSFNLSFVKSSDQRLNPFDAEPDIYSDFEDNKTLSLHNQKQNQVYFILLLFIIHI